MGTTNAAVTRRMSWERMDPDAMSFDDPFLRWFSAHFSRGQAKAIQRRDVAGIDFLMGGYASSRFSLGADDDGTPLLGVCSYEAEALERCHWVDAAFLRGMRGGDWVVLRTADVRTDEPLREDSIPARLWLPAMPGILDGWLDSSPLPTALRLMRTRVERGKALLEADKPFCEIPLVFKGNWTGE